jgi:hypothetical protein
LARYSKELKENSKIKKINELVDDFLEKCEEQRKLLRILKCLGEKNKVFEDDVVFLEENLEKEKNYKKEVLKNREDIQNQYDEFIDERTYLSRQNKSLSEKIKKYAMTNREKADRIRQKEISNQEIQAECDEIEQYKSERSTKQKIWKRK